MGGSNGAFEPGTVQVAQPYFISGKTPVLVAGAPWVAGVPIMRLAQLGMIEPKFGNVLQPTPIRISQIRMRYVSTTTPATAARAFEIIKGTAAPAGGGGPGVLNHAPQRRKTTGYPLITTAETVLTVADSAILTGTFTPLDGTLTGGPLDVVSAGSLDGGWSIWQPSDLCGCVLEAGEALEVRVLQDNTTGTGILFAAFDFLR